MIWNEWLFWISSIKRISWIVHQSCSLSSESNMSLLNQFCLNNWLFNFWIILNHFGLFIFSRLYILCMNYMVKYYDDFMLIIWSFRSLTASGLILIQKWRARKFFQNSLLCSIGEGLKQHKGE